MIKFLNSAQRKIEPESFEATLKLIPIQKIHPNPYQPRKYFSESSIRKLAESIRQVGLLQPINVRQFGQDHYELIAGERRLRACKMAGYTRIKAIVSPAVPDKDSAMFAMIENLQRENLHFFEEAEGYQSLIREHGFTQEELAKRLTKNQSTIANKLRILKLSRMVKEKIIVYNLSERHARALLRLHNEAAQLKLVERVAKENLSVKSTEDLVETELRHLYGEIKKEKSTFRIKCNHMVYLNTLRKTVSKITALGVETSFEYADKGDFLEVMVKIKK